MRKPTNVRNATVVGLSAGAVATPAIAWGAQLIEAQTGVPAMVVMPVLGALAGFITRWAAKLNPHD